MENEDRLKKLAINVESERRKGFIQVWPDDVKKEALYLVSIFGMTKVSDTTQLRKPSLLAWAKIFKNEKNSLNNNEEQKINVTRVVASSAGEVSLIVKNPIVSIIKDKVEFNIYCKDMAEKLVEKFFI